MKKLTVIIVSLLILMAPLARADFNAAMSAYDRRDYHSAFKEFSLLAEQGDAQAQFMTGYLYSGGKGVLQDYVMAHKWYNLAAALGNQSAAQARDTIAASMTPAQIAQAQDLARAWRPQADPPPAGSELPDNVQDSQGSVADNTEPLTRNDIRRIQQLLNARGYDAGAADGLMGSRTRQAISFYQVDANLPVDGKPSHAVLSSLETTAGEDEIIEPVADDFLADTDDTGIQELVAELNRLGTEAERRQGTDPWLIDRLWQLVRQYQRPWSTLVFQDNFEDGDYRYNPVWTAASGNFGPDQRGGLRTVQEIQVSNQSSQTGSQDLSTALLGALIQQTLGSGSDTSTTQTSDQSEIYLPRTIPNAFAAMITLSPRQNRGRIEFGLYRGQDRNSAYRLAYIPGSANGLELMRQNYSRSSVVEVLGRPLNLADGTRHILQWTRDLNGEMVVSLNGEELMRVTDRGLGGDFSGFQIINLGGDFTVNKITLYGSSDDS